MASGNTVFHRFAALVSGPKTPTQLSEEKVHLRRESRSQSAKKEGPPSARCGARLVGRDHRLDSDPPVHTSNVGGRRTPLRSLPDSCKGRWTTPAATLGTTLTTRSRPFPRRGSLLGSVSTGFLRSVAWVCASSS